MACAVRHACQVCRFAVKILLIKTSSLGDVVHNLPVVSDISSAMPQAWIDWCVEDSFADIARLHPSVQRVIPVALRRWRKRLASWQTWSDISDWRRELRTIEYDFVLDSQGLLKSALIARQARGALLGYNAMSAREPLSSLFYQRRFGVERSLHAVTRNRRLVRAALSPAVLPLTIDEESAPDYGIHNLAKSIPTCLHIGSQQKYSVLFTASSRAEKLWPEDNWVQICHHLLAEGIIPVLPSGNEHENERVRRIADKTSGAIVAPSMSIDEIARLLKGAALCVGVDTGLTHLAAALLVPVLAIYCHSNPELTGVLTTGWHRNLGGVAGGVDIYAALEALKEPLSQA